MDAGLEGRTGPQKSRKGIPAPLGMGRERRAREGALEKESQSQPPAGCGGRAVQAGSICSGRGRRLGRAQGTLEREVAGQWRLAGAAVVGRGKTGKAGGAQSTSCIVS